MFVLALTFALAVSPATGTAAPPAADGEEAVSKAGTRIPGTWMRLGETEGRILQRAQFPVIEGPRPKGTVVRGGPAQWFGLAGNVTLHFRDERLEGADFQIEDTAPYWVDYVRDQLQLAGYRPSCEQDDPGLQLCDWEGASHVRLELKAHQLVAKITPAGPPRPAPPAPRATRRDTVRVFPQVFVLGRGAPAGVAAPVMADSTPLVAPAYPARARDAGVQGRIWVRALVDTNGLVQSAEVLRSIPELDSAAVAVARRCRFKPYPPQGERVRFRVEIPVIFMAR